MRYLSAKLGLVGVICFLIGISAHAQSTVPETPSVGSAASGVTAPRLMKFSGVLKNAAGKPVTGVTGVTLSLYNVQEGGTPLWMETQNVSLDAQGNYTVLLGSTLSQGMPVDLFTSGESRWLGVQTSGAEEQPRVLLVTVPYALKAADADTVGGMPASAFMRAPATDQSSSYSTQFAIASSGQRIIDRIKDAALGAGTGPSVANQLTKWADTANTLTSSGVTELANGNVGIGTTNPTSKLYISNSGTSGVLGENIFVTQTQPNAGDLGDLALSLSYTLSAASATNELVNRTFSLTANNNLTGGGILQNQRTFDLVQSTAANTATTNLESIFIENGSTGGTVTNGFGLHITGLQGTNKYGIYDTSGGTWFTTGGLTAQGAITANGGLCLDTCKTAWPSGGSGTVTSISAVANGGIIATPNPITTTGTLAIDTTKVVTSLTAGTDLTASASAGPVTLALGTQSRTRSITYIAGCDNTACGLLSTSDSQRQIYQNVIAPVAPASGATMQIQNVACFVDAGTTTAINVGVNGGTGVLGTNLLCKTYAVSSTGGSQAVITNLNQNDTLDFQLAVADGATHRVTLIVTALVL